MACPAGSYDAGNRLCAECTPGFYTKGGNTICNPCEKNTVSLSGASACEPCPLGTKSDLNTCKSNCQFSINETYYAFYDLTPLKQSISTIFPNDRNDTQTVFQVNLCDKFQSVYCTLNCSENSYIFGQFNSLLQPVTLGTWLEFSPLKNISTDHRFDLIYKRGKNIPPNCSNVTTTIQFYCAVHEGKGTPTVKSYNQSCHVTFEWRTLYACPKCFPDDEVDIVGPCNKNGKRSRYTGYKIPCNGPVNYPVEEDCEEVELERSTVLVGVLIAGLLLVVGIISACYFFKQKRNIEAKYELLRNEVQEEE